MSRNLVRHSKFLSLVLRHRPEVIGLTLDAEGWASVDELITKAAHQGRELSPGLIREIVETNDKQRFALSPDGRQIRANQGHSVQVDLGLASSKPPEILYHGTAERFLASILEHGLRPGSRQHVHLSEDESTATRVGSRHGRPVVLRVAAGRLHAQGQTFFLSENGVWLTDHVPPDALFKIEQELESQ